MQRFNKWLPAVLVVATLVGLKLYADIPRPQTAAAAEPAGDHWRNFDGHWSYWHDGDKRWYYTDGKHWYYHNGTSWVVYQFDKLFGKTGFHHGDYKVPGPDARVVVPTHGIYHK